MSFSQLTRVVLDEADTLFDSSFLKDTQKIIDLVRSVESSSNVKIPVMMATATFPQTLNQATKSFKGLVRLTTSTLHRTPSKLKQDFLRLGSSTTKSNMLLEVLKRIGKSTARVLVFCNTAAQTQLVHKFLEDKSYPVVKLVSNMTQQEQAKSLKRFSEETDEFCIMVATDIASRGLDTTQVGQVLLYDFPHTVIDYMHRVGRTARFGRGGRATSFVTTKDVKLAEAIQMTMRKQQRMPSRV